MRLLDLYCGAGGAAMGYHQAGFDEIVGVAASEGGTVSDISVTLIELMAAADEVRNWHPEMTERVAQIMALRVLQAADVEVVNDDQEVVISL